jgi:hypothetical protein
VDNAAHKGGRPTPRPVTTVTIQVAHRERRARSHEGPMSLRRLPRRLAVFALLACLLSTALPTTVAAAGPPAYPSRGIVPTVRFRDLDAAVAAGVLDASVPADLRAKGQTRAIVTFDGDGILAQAQAEAPSGKGRSAAIVAAVRPALATLKARALGSGSAVRVLRQYDALAASYLAVRSSAALLRLVNQVEVTGVRKNHRSKAALVESLDLIDQPEAKADGHGGAGTSIAVLDTGLDYTRDAFGTCPTVPATGCSVAHVQDFTALDDGLLDDGAPTCVGDGACHGTNVAGIVLGVAPDAKVIGLDVFEGEYAYDDALLAALNWVVLNQTTHGIRALNMSLGGGSFAATCYDYPLEPALASVRAVGVLPVVAAGNEAEATGSFVNGIAYPACTRGAVSVGAVYDSDIYTADESYYGCDGAVPTAADQITCFSQSASILSLLAPGAMVTAAGITQGGTSQAAPHVAGAASVLAGAKPGATPTAIETALKNSGPSIPDSRNGVSRRRLDLDAAVAYLLALSSRLSWEPQLSVGPFGGWSYDENLARTVASGTHWLHTVRSRYTSTQAIEYQRSNNAGASWTAATPKRLNASSHHGEFAAVAASGSYVYTTWMRFSPSSAARSVYFRRSSAHGASGWSSAVARTSTSGRVDGPSIAATGNKVYLAYTDSNTGAIRIQRSTNNGTDWVSLPSPGTTTATAGSGGGLGRWGNPEIAAVGTKVIVVWRASNTGSLKARISTNSGSSWQAAVTLDSNATDLAVAAAGSRLAAGWTDAGAMRSKVWNNGTWQTTRTVGTVSSSGTYKVAYSPAIALVGTGGLDVAWSACKTSGCGGSSSGSGINLLWRESTNNGSTWKAAAAIIANSTESGNRRINDGADIERVSTTVRHVMFTGWTLNSAGTEVTASQMHLRTGRGS